MQPTITLLLSNFLATPLNILLHEFGHAIAALLLTPNPVHINLGPLNQVRLFDISIGRLRVSFGWRNLFFHYGFTRHSGAKSIWAERTIILSGVAANVVCMVGLWVAFAKRIESTGAAALFLGVLLNCFLIIISNLWPRVAHIDKEPYDTDGLLFLKSFRKAENLWTKLLDEYDHRRFENCIDLLKQMKADDSMPTINLRAAVLVCTRPAGYDELVRFSNTLATRSLEMEDIVALFFAYAHLKEFDKATTYLTQWQKCTPGLSSHNTNLAFLSLAKGDMLQAKELFETALKDRANAYIYANLAYILSHFGDTKQSEEYLNKARELDEHEPYLFRAIAQIQMEKGNLSAAKAAYEKAIQLKDDIYPLTGL